MSVPLIKRFRKLSRIAPRLTPLVFAVVIVIVLLLTHSEPVKKDVTEIIRPLRVIKAPLVVLIPKTLGYGLVEPRRIWRVMAEVKGAIVATHPQLESGALVKEGTVLLKINSADYDLAMARLKSSIGETHARLHELTAEEKSQNASLKIEKRSLTLAQKSLERLYKLFKKNVVAPDAIDREERNFLKQKQAIQRIENAIAQIPARREALEAALAVQKNNLKQAELDLKRTVIRAPFDCRLGNVKLGKGQYLNAGQLLFEAHGTDVVEVEAKFRPEQLRNLLPPKKRLQFQPGITMKKLCKLFDLTVTIRLRSGNWEASWPARFDRIRETVDPRTRVINVVAVIDKPYEKIIPGVRPALIRGMYCEMELRAPSRPNTIVLPRSAVRNKVVCLINKNGRLQKRKIEIAFAQDNLVVVKSGLIGGETVIVSDPAPAIEGMLVKPVVDSQFTASIVQQAEGREAPR